MTRYVAAGGFFVWGLLAWASGCASAQAHLLSRPAPEVAGGPWLNSPPLTLRAGLPFIPPDARSGENGLKALSEKTRDPIKTFVRG